MSASHRWPAGHRSDLRRRRRQEAAEGRIPRPRHGACPWRLQSRLLRVAAAAAIGPRSGRRGAPAADPHHPCHLTPDLWRAAGSCRADRAGCAPQLQADCPADARGRARRRQPTPERARHHPPRAREPPGRRPGAARLPGRWPEPAPSGAAAPAAPQSDRPKADGSRISPSCRPRRGSSIWPSCSTPGAVESSARRGLLTAAPPGMDRPLLCGRWAMANHLRAELVLDALEMAIGQRHPRGVVLHSDQGSQYTSVAFGMRCKEAGVRPSPPAPAGAVRFANRMIRLLADHGLRRRCLR